MLSQVSIILISNYNLWSSIIIHIDLITGNLLMYRISSGPATLAHIVLVYWVYQASKSTKDKEAVVKLYLSSMPNIPRILRTWNQAFKRNLPLWIWWSKSPSLACTYCIRLQIQDIHITKNNCAITQCAITGDTAHTCMRSAANNHYFPVSIVLGDKTASMRPPRRCHLWPCGPYSRSQI